jgi:hypothetical protein
MFVCRSLFEGWGVITHVAALKGCVCLTIAPSDTIARRFGCRTGRSIGYVTASRCDKHAARAKGYVRKYADVDVVPTGVNDISELERPAPMHAASQRAGTVSVPSTPFTK